MGYINPLLKLPAAEALLALPKEQRLVIEGLFRDLRAQADKEAENAWRRRKGPMAAYWRAVATYSRHTANAFGRGGLSLVRGGQAQMRAQHHALPAKATSAAGAAAAPESTTATSRMANAA